jgi:hypothetical protein
VHEEAGVLVLATSFQIKKQRVCVREIANSMGAWAGSVHVELTGNHEKFCQHLSCGDWPQPTYVSSVPPTGDAATRGPFFSES